MDISDILTFFFMLLILLIGILGIFSPKTIVNYYMKYTNNHHKVVKITGKSWFFTSLKISSMLLILYATTIIFLIIKFSFRDR